MTFTISTKVLVAGVAISVLAIASSVSFVAYKAGAQESSNDIISNNAQADQDAGNIADGIPTGQSNIPHLTCSDQANYAGLESSEVYNPNADYSHPFMGSGLQTQDVNGDNLPDYIYSNNQSTLSGDIISVTTIGCTYLNNGHGWDKVYFCYAKTRSDLANNGNIIEAVYRGDCAGTPSN